MLRRVWTRCWTGTIVLLSIAASACSNESLDSGSLNHLGSDGPAGQAFEGTIDSVATIAISDPFGLLGGPPSIEVSGQELGAFELALGLRSWLVVPLSEDGDIARTRCGGVGVTLKDKDGAELGSLSYPCSNTAEAVADIDTDGKLVSRDAAQAQVYMFGSLVALKRLVAGERLRVRDALDEFTSVVAHNEDGTEEKRDRNETYGALGPESDRLIELGVAAECPNPTVLDFRNEGLIGSTLRLKSIDRASLNIARGSVAICDDGTATLYSGNASPNHDEKRSPVVGKFEVSDLATLIGN